MTEQVELIAFYQLTQAEAKYCRTLDSKDWNGLTALMTAGIEFGMSDGKSDDALRGRHSPQCERLLRTVCGQARCAPSSAVRCRTAERSLMSALGETRTHTARVLNPFPLPIGIRGPARVTTLKDRGPDTDIRSAARTR